MRDIQPSTVTPAPGPSDGARRSGPSLERRLPLLIAGLLTIAVGALLLAIKGELERAEVEAAHARLVSGITQLGQLVDRSSRATLQLHQEIARSPLIRRFAARGGGSQNDTVRVRATLSPFGNQGGRYVELVTPRGDPIIALGSRPDTLAAATREIARDLTARDSVVQVRPMLVGTHAFTSSAAPVVVDGVLVGAVIRWARVGSDPAAEEALRQLVDPRAELYLSNPEAGIVIDPGGELAEIVFPVGDTSSSFFTQREGRELLGARAVPASTAWRIVALVPRDLIVLGSSALFNRLLMAGLAIVLVGTLVGWLASRRITKPLLRVTEAAEALAAGEYQQRIAMTREDEIGRLAGTFDVMANRIAEAHDRISAARAEAELANAAKSRFLGTMSHEIRTPLNAIIGYTEFLLVGIGGPVSPQQRSYVERVQTSARHLLALVSDLLDLSSIEAGRLRVQCHPAPLRDAVHDSVAVLDSQAQQREITIAVRGDSALWYRGDPARLRQILINLLSNAIKFTEPGGRVVIECGATRETGPAVSDRAERAWTTVTVRDSGAGIPPEKVATIWDAFVQGDDSRTRTHGGSGLGLTISRRLARLMGGEITVTSEPGHGSEFTVWLPASEPDQAANAVTAA
jgi:signal transduction histidine kinase